MTDTKKTMPTISIESQELIKRFLDAKEGELISYADLNQVVMGDIRNGKRYAIYTAAKRLRHDHQIVVQCVAGEGYRRATPIEVLNEAEQGVKLTHRRIGRDVEKLSTIEYDTLSKEDKVKHNAKASQLGALYLMTGVKHTRTIERKVAEVQAKLDVGDTIKLFAK